METLCSGDGGEMNRDSPRQKKCSWIKNPSRESLPKLYGPLPSWWPEALHSLTVNDVQGGVDFVSAIFTGVDAGVGELQIPHA